MQIKAHVAQGHLVFECDGVFVDSIEKVTLNKDTGFFKFKFERSGDEVDLDCPLQHDLIPTLIGQTICGVGLFFRGKLMASAFVPLEVR